MIVGDMTYDGRHDEIEVRTAVALINVDNFCQRYSCLPDVGGLLNQNSLLIQGLELVVDAYGERQKLEEDKQKNAT